LPLQSRIWSLECPPSGVDGQRWSATWFVPLAIDRWARQHEAVQEAVRKLEANHDCLYTEVLPDGPLSGGTGSLRLLVMASLNDTEPHIRPMEEALVPVQHEIAAQILLLDGILRRSDQRDSSGRNPPLSPHNNEVEQRAHVVLGKGGGPAEMWNALKPLYALSKMRKLKAGPARRELGMTARKGGLRYRKPGGKGRQFTDMLPNELVCVVEEAANLVESVRSSPAESWPLSPMELQRIFEPPPMRNRPSDYTARLEEMSHFPDDVETLRPATVLANDLTLIRLGYDPDDRDARNNLRVELSRNQMAAN